MEKQTKYAKDVVRGDTILLDCGYGLQENFKSCKVISVDKLLPLFESDRNDDNISFYVDVGGSRFTSTGFSPFYEMDLT